MGLGGPYGGLNVGVALQRADATTTTTLTPSGYFTASSIPVIAATGAERLTPTAWAGGAVIGYNALGRRLWLVGFEADLGPMLASSSKSASAVYPCCAPSAFTIDQSIKTQWLFTARPRVGVMAGSLLFFGTGGLALTNIDYESVFTDTFGSAHESATVKEMSTGWTAGGGVECAIGDRWSLAAQYLYAAFRHVSTTSTNLQAFSPPTSFPDPFDHVMDLRASVVRVGLNVRF